MQRRHELDRGNVRLRQKIPFSSLTPQWPFHLWAIGALERIDKFLERPEPQWYGLNRTANKHFLRTVARRGRKKCGI